MQIYGFGPVVNDQSRILILGSMPSVTSLNQHQYYAFYRNHFWRIIFDLFGEQYIDNYSKRLNYMLSKKIALWDVVKSCIRKGSLDSKIKQPLVNNFRWLFYSYPKLNQVVFNGTKAKQLFYRHVNKALYDQKVCTLVPSSSPANTKPYSLKLEQWKKVFSGSAHFRVVSAK